MILVAFLTMLFSAAATRALVKRGGLASDIPNQRSSHSAPTPRGGGVAIGVAMLVALSSRMSLFESQQLTYAVLFSILMLALGIREDRSSLSAKMRLSIQTVGALIVVLAGNLSIPQLGWGAWTWDIPSALSIPLSVIWIVWVLNLFNFMDGINGIACQQGLAVALGIAVFPGQTTSVSAIALWMGAAIIGFLPFNFPRARIFMGDSGSLFLGAWIAILPLLSQRPGSFHGGDAILVIAPFFLDASITLIKRLIRGEKVTTAHRGHHYQMLTDLLGSHTPVTIWYSAWSMLFVTLMIMRASALPQAIAVMALLAWFGLISFKHRQFVRQQIKGT